MKNDKKFHVFSCDASTNQVSLSWAICDDTLSITECAQLQYLRSNTRECIDRFVPSVERLRETVSADYNNLRCICCTIGPGSFTGIRNTLAFVKGIIAVRYVENSSIQAIGVRTHDAIAYQYSNAKKCDTPLLVVNDARKGRYYSALYSLSMRTKSRQENLQIYEVHPEIHDYSVDEISDMVSDCSSLECAGNASEHIVSMLQRRKNAMRLEMLCGATCTMAQAVHEVGLTYYKRNIYEITQLSQPLYVRSAVSCN